MTTLLFCSGVVTVRETGPGVPNGTPADGRASGLLLVFARDGAGADPTEVLVVGAGERPRVAGPARTCLAFAPDALAAPGLRRRVIAGAEALLRFHALRAALLRPGPRAGAAARALEADALALARQVLASPGGGAPGASSPRRREIVDGARAVLAGAPGRAHQLADVARAVGVSASHLAHVFRAETGLPPHRYLLHLRLAIALERLGASDARLSALALDLGFATHSHFSAAFRRWCGMSPAAARRLLAAPGAAAAERAA